MAHGRLVITAYSRRVASLPQTFICGLAACRPGEGLLVAIHQGARPYAGLEIKGCGMIAEQRPSRIRMLFDNPELDAAVARPVLGRVVLDEGLVFAIAPRGHAASVDTVLNHVITDGICTALAQALIRR